ncbi:ribbon-helix-helix domain-containing protein [Algihabitans albus]|uniref:ribbon-helix-helix domain-containing protein n=1 Tax=Algihabitans albus TaxID=2164067 RepID=UPI000E5CB990|nr:ribbon-helix-helix domain-containing protein [Algihabitans albus]
MQRYRDETRTEPRTDSTLVSRNVTVRGRRTSLRLEPAMWDAFAEVCNRETMTPSVLCSEIDRTRRPEGSLTAAVRVFLLAYFREAATEQGHREASHASSSF